MVSKIKKDSGFYQESLVWMGYRYAIGLAGAKSERGRELLDSLGQFRDIEYDTPEFHAFAAEIANYLKRKKIKDVTDLSKRWMEGDMMWYSMHYALGRQSYASSHCHDIVRYGREVLSPDRQEFMAYDIRREIAWHLSVPIHFHLPCEIERLHDPIDLLMRFLKENDIRTDEQLAKYKTIEVWENQIGDIRYDTTIEEDESKRMSIGLLSEIDALLPWDDLAKYFDPKMHKRCRVNYNGEESVVEYFDSWKREYGEHDTFPYMLLKKPVLKYEQNPYLCTYINEEYVVEDNV